MGKGRAGRWRRKLLTNPGKRCLVTRIRVIVVEREVVRFQIYFEGSQGLLIDGMRGRGKTEELS